MLIPILGNIVAALNRIGQSSDVASSSGTVHAKLGDLRNNIVRSSKLGSFSTTATAWTTALSLTGPGRLVYLTCYNATGSQYVRITIDGGTPIVMINGAGTGGLNLTLFGYQSSMIEIDVIFKNSLLIECYTSTSASAEQVTWQYEQ